MKIEQWNRFVKEALCNFDECSSNLRFPFSTLTKKYGLAYIEYCRAAWKASDNISAEEFAFINGNMPQGFFEKVINIGDKK